MALKQITSGTAIAISYAYTIDTTLDEGNVPKDVSFLNLSNNIIYKKDLLGKILPVGKLSNLTSDASFVNSDSNEIAYSIALGGGF